MTRVLVTGGAGFIGSHVVDALLLHGCTVLVVDNLSTGSPENVASGAEIVVADITDDQALAETMLQFSPEVIVHLAAQTDVAVSVNDPERDAAVNILGTLSVLRSGAASGCRKVIFASSSTVYGDPMRQPVDEDDRLNPISPYGASKAAGEQYVRIVAAQHGVAHTVLRLGNVVGPRDSPRAHHVIPAFVDALLAGRAPIIEWDGEQAKDYVSVSDVAAAVTAALTHGDGGVFNVGNEVATSVNELFELVCTVMRRSVTPRRGPRRPGDVRRFVMNCSRAHDILGWHARTPLPEAVASTVEFLGGMRPAAAAPQIAGERR